MLQEVSKGHRFRELDSLRGLAAIAVVLGHFRGGLITGPPRAFTMATRVLGTGHAAVVLFFLLSGFVLTVPYLGVRRPAYSAFLIKRICRIYLPYIAAIAIAAAIASRLYSATPTGNAWVDQTWSKPFSMHLLLQHLLMLGHFDDVQWNTVIWSLVIEMRISLAFPVIAWCTARFQPLPLALLCAPATPALAWLLQRSGHGMLCDTLFYSMMFVAGSLLRRNYDTLHSHLLRHASGPLPVILTVAGVLLYQVGENVPFIQTGVSQPLANYFSDWAIASGALLLILLSTTSQSLRHLLHSRILLWAGTRSYSIYLLHGTVLFILIRTHRMQTLSLPTFAAYLATVFASAEIFHRLIEVPALLAGRRLGSNTVPNSLNRHASASVPVA